MTQINSQIGLDASQALASLNALGKATQDYEADVRNLTRAFKGLPAASKGLTSVSSASKQASKDLAEMRKNSERMATSLGLLSRIVFTQAVVRGLSALRRQFGETTRDAIAFQRQIALIRTIDDSGASFAAIGEGIKQLSNDLNISLEDVGEGVFTSISNQVGDFRESLDFAKEAGLFAKATGTTMKDAVNLLSGAIKATNSDFADADKVASVFFKTIDLSRAEVDQLSNAFGRVGPVASSVGVTLEEQGALISAISVRGLNTAETLTQVRAIMTALLKPSKGMSEALTALGFSSGEAAVKTLGLEGVLRKLSENSSPSLLAELFQNVRALGGVTAITSDDMKTLAANIAEMNAAGRDTSLQAALEVMSTPAEKLTARLNELKNALTTELGPELINFANIIVDDVFGGIGTAIGAVRDQIQGFAGPLKELVAAMQDSDSGVVQRAANITNALAKLATAPIQGMFATTNRKALESNLAPLADARQNSQKELDDFKKAKKAEIDEQRKSDVQKIASQRQTSQKAIAEFQKQMEEIKKLRKQFPEGPEGFFSAKEQAAQANLRRATGATSPDAVSAAIDKQQKALQDAKNSQLNNELRNATRQKFLSDAQSGLSLMRQDLQGLETSGVGAKLLEIAANAEKVGEQAKISGADIKGLTAQLQTVGDALGKDPAAAAQFTTAMAFLGQAIVDLGKSSNVKQQLDPGVASSKALADNMERAALAAPKITVPPGAIATQALGGLMRAMGGHVDYRARGGRGTDTVPAMLSRGEFVVNARSARQFFPQLQAINAGQNPVYRQDGGSVDNSIRVGDVNISGSTKGPMTARDIARELNRELRRGTSTLRR